MTGRGDTTARDLRHEKKRQRLGMNAACAECNEENVCCLVRFKSGEIYCLNCKKKRKAISVSAVRRKTGLLKKLGYSEFWCHYCAERDLRTFDSHHVAAEANSELQVPLCMNCHAIQSDIHEDLLGDLRRRDPDRRPLALQAAFELGLAALLVGWTIGTRAEEHLRVFCAALVVMLIAWAVWNLAADDYLARTYGPKYSRDVPADVPQ